MNVGPGTWKSAAFSPVTLYFTGKKPYFVPVTAKVADVLPFVNVIFVGLIKRCGDGDSATVIFLYG